MRHSPSPPGASPALPAPDPRAPEAGAPAAEGSGRAAARRPGERDRLPTPPPVGARLPARPAPYRTPWWLSNPHAQTVVGKFLRPRPRLPLSLEWWETPDGDRLQVGFGPDPGRDAPVVLVLHGLEGNLDRSYVRLTLDALGRRGALPVALNFRGCGGPPNRRPRFYHSGDTTDPGFVLEGLAERFPGRPLGAIGFSLGGNMLLRWLGERREGAGDVVGGAVAVSVPYDLAGGTGVLESGLMGRVYTHYFLRSLRRKVLAKRALLEGVLDLPEVLAAPTLRRFDDLATAPLHGFRDAADYYERCRVEPVLREVRVPTLLVQSRDDPFLPPDSIPEGVVQDNPWLVPAFTAAGGHVGFVSGAPWSPRFWAEEESARWITDLLRGHRQAPP